MPAHDDARYWWLALNTVPLIGAVRLVALVRKFGSAQAVLEAPDAQLARVEDVGEKVIEAIRHQVDFQRAEIQLEKLEKSGAKMLTILEADYPEPLKRIYDPPPFLFVRGELRKDDAQAVGIVGSRICSTYGRQVTEMLATELSKAGLCIVSGLARGIDSVAHQAAIASGGRTVAVLGCGLDVIYPPENKGLYDEVAAHGAIVTEFEFGLRPDKYNFPSRNRIISGLARGVIVVEARRGSGALLTARHAVEQNREVFAVPGNITSATSHGTNELLKQGAAPVTQAADVLLALGLHPLQKRAAVARPTVKLAEREQAVYDQLSDQPQLVDSLSQDLQRPVQEVLSLLLSLEMAGLVRQLPGKLFLRAV